MVTDTDALKHAAAARAVELVRDGMTVGLGTGTTASLFVTALGRRVADGLAVTALASSEQTAQLATQDCDGSQNTCPVGQVHV